MDRATAERLMEIYERLGNVLNEADPVLRALADEEEKRRHLRALGTMMTDVWINLMLPIVREHAELDPDKTK